MDTSMEIDFHGHVIDDDTQSPSYLSYMSVTINATYSEDEKG